MAKIVLTSFQLFGFCNLMFEPGSNMMYTSAAIARAVES